MSQATMDQVMSNGVWGFFNMFYNALKYGHENDETQKKKKKKKIWWCHTSAPLYLVMANYGFMFNYVMHEPLSHTLCDNQFAKLCHIVHVRMTSLALRDQSAILHYMIHALFPLHMTQNWHVYYVYASSYCFV